MPTNIRVNLILVRTVSVQVTEIP